jgi:hypothetical protein
MLARGWMSRVNYFIPPPLPADYDPELVDTIRRVRRHTMTSHLRQAALRDAVEHVESNRVPGAIVECGVWRGGSMMAVAITLMRRSATRRDLYLFDTFAGMTEPTEADVDSAYDGYAVASRWRRGATPDGGSNWGRASVDEVRRNMESTGYPAERIHYVQGPVEETIPASAPDSIAVLRLDTDWYASTRHELEHLYPRLSVAGVLIVDDYGHYAGARRAVDEYFTEHGNRPFLHRVDYTGRAGVKVVGSP